MRRPVRIRGARAADAPAILRLEQEFPGDRMSARSVRRFLRSPAARVLMAESGKPPVVVGALVLLTRRGSRTGRIYSVSVDPAGRGRGVGAALVSAAEAEARRRGCRAMSLEVRTDNAAALGLYRKLGYGPLATLPAYYDDGAAGVRLGKPLTGRATPAS